MASRFAFFAVAALGAACSQPAFAQEGAAPLARDGFRAEARATWETPTVSSVLENNDVYKLGSAFAFGAEGGFDVALTDRIVVGPYATYEKSNVSNCEGTDCVSADDNMAFGLHLGYALNAKGQIYGKLGHAKMAISVDAGGLQESESGSGVEFAVGYEHGLGRNLYGRVEFGYADNGQIFGINFQRRHAGIALGARF